LLALWVIAYMNEFLERPLKELFAAVFHDHQKHGGREIRPDQEKVLNELLEQPEDYKNSVLLMDDGLEVHTQKENIYYIHSNRLDARVIKVRPRK
jgi:hypothetical protein